MKKRILAALSALMAGGIMFSGCGMHGPHFGGEFSPKQMHTVMKKLDLSSEQKDALRALRNEHKDGKKHLKEMAQFFTPTQFDAEAMRTYMNTHAQERIDLRVDFIQKAYNILTVEQRQILLQELSKI